MTATRGRLVAAFASLYLFWGATYLFIRFAVETLPPLGMAGIRFLLAGAMLYGVLALRGATSAPSRAEWRSAAIVGMLLMSSNACVAWAERRIPSGATSLLVAMTPCWMVLFDWLRAGGRPPRSGVVWGLLAGTAGVLILIGPARIAGSGQLDALGSVVVLAGSVGWSFGSIYSRHAPRPASTLQASAMQMLCGGAALTAFSLVIGQYDGFSLSQVSARSWIGFAYLLFVGSLVGYSSFAYLLRHTTPPRVSTYAYVNPVVAVFLGWLFAGEALTPRVLVAAVVIIGAVAVITSFGGARGQPAPRASAPVPDTATPG